MKKLMNVLVFAMVFFVLGINFASPMPLDDPNMNPGSGQGVPENSLDTMEPRQPPMPSAEPCITPFHSQSEPGISPEPIEPKEIFPANPQSSSGPQPLGTAGEVDALGPYGTSASPYYEGDSVTFNANIINGSLNDYLFRWDVNNDGIWEKDFSGAIKGDAAYTHEFGNDHIGLAKVEAWDGFSYETITTEGRPYSDQKDTHETYLNYSYYWTVGYKFKVCKDIMVNQLGYYDADYPQDIYNIRLWTDTGTLLAQYNDPLPQPDNTWDFWNIPSTALYAGETYRLSVYIEGYLMPACYDLQPSPDGAVEFSNMVYSDSNSFPSSELGNLLPMIDINYSCTYSIPDTIEDYADVYMENVLPFVDAGQEIVGYVGEPVLFNGSFSDPGKDDPHTIYWNFGDGNSSSGDLTPSHVYGLPGTYIAVLTVEDDKGNGSDDVTVIILENDTIGGHLAELRVMVDDLGLPKGLENALLSKLDNAQMCLEKGNLKAAMNILEAFIHHLEAQSGKKIPDAMADELVDLAQIIIDLIEAEM